MHGGAEGSTGRLESPNSFGFPGGDSSHAEGRANPESYDHEAEGGGAGGERKVGQAGSGRS